MLLFFIFLIILIIVEVYGLGVTINKRKDEPKIVISHTGFIEGYSTAFVLVNMGTSLLFYYNTSQFLPRIIASFLLLALVLPVVVYYRIKHKQFSIGYSEGKKVYIKILYRTLEKYGIPYTYSNIDITPTGYSFKIVYTNQGFIIKNYKKVPDYENFFKDLESSIMSSPVKKVNVTRSIILLSVILIVTIVIAVLVGVRIF